MGMDRQSCHFFRPFPARFREVSSDGQSAVVDKLGIRGISRSQSRLLTGPHCYHPGIVQ
jgi:hypothetical protein